MFNTDDLSLVHKRIGDLLDLLDSAQITRSPSTPQSTCAWTALDVSRCWLITTNSAVTSSVLALATRSKSTSA